jgi:predicted CopG family antitoxin
MGTKTISIMDDAYDLLARNKKENESFSDVIRRFAYRKEDMMKYFGSWSDLSEEEVADMKEAIAKARKSKRDYLA